jgi:flagellar biosynthesis GTPase FlhF
MALKTITVSIALLGLAAGAAQAADPAPQAEPQQQIQQERRAVRDSVTGKLRAPTEEELAAMNAQRNARAQQQRSAPAAPLVVRQHANGMRSAVLGPEYRSTLKAERGSDGKLVIRHANPADDHVGHANSNPAARPAQ